MGRAKIGLVTDIRWSYIRYLLLMSKITSPFQENRRSTVPFRLLAAETHRPAVRHDRFGQEPEADAADHGRLGEDLLRPQAALRGQPLHSELCLWVSDRAGWCCMYVVSVSFKMHNDSFSDSRATKSTINCWKTRGRRSGEMHTNRRRVAFSKREYG